ncbi:Uncharacterised protein [Corynebacterium striatum]|uniref:Uncharacterized protein n=1 Tax=Corynebacterium striatum TaxID=43770 RepID=A0AAQ1TXU4_CORST|nr:hypothetical protein [Corynebacterium striatum]EEI77628.1 hypothetical protein HMPREF0308_2094 [Corynebacterium striatum ATCC 6940]QQE52030.1 hypothetical protein I6I11_07590 [Corynebacterium striatum]STD63077.1 Uncharacterised protein [Corynebacterium striatum]GEA42054.1 hypothetical protein Cst04h_02240 [Corynebacterium striatum]GEA44707.1 hypothetical protein Cst04h_28770 [Corynebacterium striatum]
MPENTNPENTSQAQENPAGQEPNTQPETNQPQQETNQPAGGIEDLPEWAQKEIRSLRDESAKYRTRSKDAEAAKADELKAAQEKAEQERNQLIQDIGKKLGLVEDETSDPQKLIDAAVEREQAAAKERDEMRDTLTKYRRNDAVRAAVSKVDGTVDTDLLAAVLNSDNAYTQLDVNADDFETQVAQIVTNKIESHPSLVQATHKASGVDTSNTQRGAARQLTREDLKSMTATEINKAVREGRVANLMKN